MKAPTLVFSWLKIEDTVYSNSLYCNKSSITLINENTLVLKYKVHALIYAIFKINLIQLTSIETLSKLKKCKSDNLLMEKVLKIEKFLFFTANSFHNYYFLSDWAPHSDYSPLLPEKFPLVIKGAEQTEQRTNASIESNSESYGVNDVHSLCQIYPSSKENCIERLKSLMFTEERSVCDLETSDSEDFDDLRGLERNYAQIVKNAENLAQKGFKFLKLVRIMELDSFSQMQGIVKVKI